jgi:oligopeptide transport system substrate-binding protein
MTELRFSLRGIFVSALFVILPLQAIAAEQVLRKGNGVEPESLDPHKAEGTSSANILRDLYEGLTSEAPNADVIPGAAERWERSADGLTYTFYLRRNARWSNGDPVTAHDFVAGLRRSVDPATGSNYSQILSPIENADEVIAGKLPPERLGAVALDDHTLRVRLKQPTPYFLGLLNHSSSYPIHVPSLRQHGERFARPGNLVSNGAYRLAEWVVQSHTTLVRNPHYWDNANVTIDRVIYFPTENLGSELKRYRAGELDWTENVPNTQLRWLRQHLGDELHIAPYLGIYYYGLNIEQPPFRDNPKLRRALYLAIDREILTGRITGAGEVPAYGWVPPGTANYVPFVPEVANWTQEQRDAEARRLYREAGYSEQNPLEVEILYNTQENHKKIAITIAYMWKRTLGVRARLVNQEWKVYLQNRRFKKTTQAFRAGWIGDFNDPYTFFELLRSDYGLNDTGFDSAEYDRLLDLAGREIDLDVRKRHLQQAEELLLEHMPVIPIFYYVSKHLVKPHVTGWQPNVMDHHYTKNFRLAPR